MYKVEVEEIIKTMKNNNRSKEVDCLFKKASKNDLVIFDEIEELINDNKKMQLDDPNKIKIPIEIKKIYEQHEPYCIPSIGGGINLLNLKQIRKENIYNEPGKYILKKGYLIIGLTYHGIIICLNLNKQQPNVLIGYFDFCRYNQNTCETEIVYFPTNLIRENMKEETLEFTTENIEKSLVELSPSFDQFLKEILDYKILNSYIRKKDFVYKEIDKDIIKYKFGIHIHDSNDIFIRLNLQRNMRNLEEALNLASEMSPKTLSEKIDKVLINNNLIEKEYYETEEIEINSNSIKIISYYFSDDSNLLLEDYTVTINTLTFKKLLDISVSKRAEIRASSLPWNYIN